MVFRIFTGTAIVMIILFAILIASNLYSVYVIKNGIINDALNEMSIHMSDINNSFNNALNDLNGVALSTDVIIRLRSSNGTARYFAASRLSDILSKRITTSKTTVSASENSVANFSTEKEPTQQ